MNNPAFGGGALDTIIHPLVLVAMLIVIALMHLLPRKYVVVPFLLGTFLTPLGQVFVIAGSHVYVMRMLILFGWIRLLRIKSSSKDSLFAGRLNSIDWAFLVGALYHALAGVLLWGHQAAVIKQVGFLWNVVGGYFLLRYLIQDDDDIYRVIKVFAVIAAINALGMLNEQSTQQNIFGLLGGHQSVPFIRGGNIRSQGVFQHAILAGTFGATMLPLFWLLWKSGKSTFAAFTGVVSSIVMIVTSYSSTPALVSGAEILALCFWPLRKQMRMVRWVVVIILATLHFNMKAPVWFLIARIDVVGFSSGYHRALLIDIFVNKFWEWWLIGVQSTADWGWDMWDLQNQYVQVGQTGGLVSFICFILLFHWSFRNLGTARKAVEGDRKQEVFIWLLSVALFAQCVAYFGATYFDQTKVLWFVILAIIIAATDSRIDKPTKQM